MNVCPAVLTVVDRNPDAGVDHDVLPRAQGDLHLRHDVPQHGFAVLELARAEQLDHRRPGTVATASGRTSADRRPPERLVSRLVAVGRQLEARRAAWRKPSRGSIWPNATNGSNTVSPSPSPSLFLAGRQDHLAAGAQDRAARQSCANSDVLERDGDVAEPAAPRPSPSPCRSKRHDDLVLARAGRALLVQELVADRIGAVTAERSS